MTEYVTITKQQAINLLAEIAELRAQITDLTERRDYYYMKSKNLREELDGLKKEERVE